MRTILVTGSNTGVGKTQAVAALVRLLAQAGGRVQIVKPVETGAPAEGDAERARRLAGVEAETFTLRRLAAPLAPVFAAAVEGTGFDFDALAAEVSALPVCDWRVIEGAGGVATPLAQAGLDWADFALAAKADAIVVVVTDCLGAINQGRLAWKHAMQTGLPAGVWLNAIEAGINGAVQASNQAGLTAAGVPLWAVQQFGACAPNKPDETCKKFVGLGQNSSHVAKAADLVGFGLTVPDRCREAMVEREKKGLRRVLRLSNPAGAMLNLADNDYLSLAGDSSLAQAAAEAAKRYGTSASASPLVSGWREPHETLVRELCDWHGFQYGLLWSSGFAANAAVLGVLPQKGDLVLADRLVHHSMIAGLLRSGARVQRYEHLHLEQLEQLLAKNAGAGRTVFVVTESVFSMDGDHPDLARLADLKRRFGFFLVVDEAHALGWYGKDGAGLVEEAVIGEAVDVVIGTLGKTLASGGAYSLFRDESVRDYLTNHAGEFIYSTALSPLCTAVGSAAIRRVKQLVGGQHEWRQQSRGLRERLGREGWTVPPGDSPIVPLHLGSVDEVLSLSLALKEQGILVGAVRPPTVPAGTSRLRLSLKRTFDRAAEDRLVMALQTWRAVR